jgi:hypothetical protein
MTTVSHWYQHIYAIPTLMAVPPLRKTQASEIRKILLEIIPVSRRYRHFLSHLEAADSTAYEDLIQQDSIRV